MLEMMAAVCSRPSQFMLEGVESSIAHGFGFGEGAGRND
jgi:hypothetical protein